MRSPPALLALLAACGGSTVAASSNDAGTTGDSGAAVMALGAPCVLAQEQNTSFTGSSLQEVSIEAYPAGASGAPVCLANHFQGRESCPYGQRSDTPPGAACKTPGGAPVTGVVPAQCLDRRADRAVYYSCRCADASGSTNDGDTYCTCPGNMACMQIVSSVGAPNDHTSGAYCILNGTAFDPNGCTATCDATLANCP